MIKNKLFIVLGSMMLVTSSFAASNNNVCSILKDEKDIAIKNNNYSKNKGNSFNDREIIWENDRLDPVSWGGLYRFGLDGRDPMHECIATFPQETWDRIKNGTFYVNLTGGFPQMRVTTGWWSTTWTGEDIFPDNERLKDNGDGTWTLEVNFDGDNIRELLDAQHLLFTGQGYTPLNIYFENPVPQKEYTLWENDGEGPATWSEETYRFGVEGCIEPEKCLKMFSQDEWEVIKTQTFYLFFSADSSDPEHLPIIRVIDGWRQKSWRDSDIYLGDPLITDNGDGTYTLKIDFKGDSILDLLDEHHLLFTGQHYTPLKLSYFGDAPSHSIINLRKESDASRYHGYLEVKESEYETAEVQVTPHIEEGFIFVEDSVQVYDADGNYYEVSESEEGYYTFVMPTVDVTVTAEFGTLSPSYTIISPTGVDKGSVIYADSSEDPVIAGCFVGGFVKSLHIGRKCSGIIVKKVTTGDTVDVIYAYDESTGNGEFIFRMPADDVTIEAVFEKDVRELSITPITGVDAGTSISLDSESTSSAVAGGIVHGVVSNLKTGRRCKGITVTTGSGETVAVKFTYNALTCGGDFEFIMPHDTVTITASFEDNVNNIVIAPNSDATITIDGGNNVVAGQNVTGNVSNVVNGKKCVGVIITSSTHESVDATFTPNSNGGTFSFTMPNNAVSISLKFETTSNVGMIAGIVVGSVLAVGLVTLLIVLAAKKKKKNPETK